MKKWLLRVALPGVLATAARTVRMSNPPAAEKSPAYSISTVLPGFSGLPGWKRSGHQEFSGEVPAPRRMTLKHSGKI